MGVRKVRDATFWGVPVGTPIAPGMKPRKGSPAKTAAKVMAGPSGSHWPGGDWRKPETGSSKPIPHVLPGNRPATGPSSHVRGPAAPGSWPSGSASRASKTSAAARFSTGANLGRETAAKHRTAAAQHITGGDIVKVNNSGQELKVVRAREFRGDPGYDLQTGSSSEHTTWFPASAVSRGSPQSLHDVVNQRGVPDVAKRTPASTPKTARGTFDAARVADVSRTLNTAANRAAAEQAVSKLSGPQLRSVAKANKVSIGSGWSVARIREQLVESLAGRRLDSKALTRR